MNKASIFTDIKRRLGSRSLFYVCRDAERAAALLDIKDIGYYIITNNSPYAKVLAKKYKNIILNDSAEQLDTRELLTGPEAKKNIKKDDFVLVFKNTPEMEKICKGYSWRLLNPSAELAAKVEEKISQVKWLGPLAKYLPPHKIMECEKIKWPARIATRSVAGGAGKKFILQFNRSHTGSGTILVETKKQLDEIKEKFPKREARVSELIDGPVFTNNNIAWKQNVFMGNINYQITGLAPFTDSPFATIGNDWALPFKILSKKQMAEYQKICQAVGKRLIGQGWRGLFGVDIIMDKKSGRLYLLEINARQPASTTYESELQSQESRIKNQVTTFEAHIAALLGAEPENYELTKIGGGAQIIKRIKQQAVGIKRDETKKLQRAGFNIIEYDNTKPGSDRLRIQNKRGIMLRHNTFNKHGLVIKKLIA